MRFKEYLTEQDWSVKKSTTNNDFEITTTDSATDVVETTPIESDELKNQSND